MLTKAPFQQVALLGMHQPNPTVLYPDGQTFHGCPLVCNLDLHDTCQGVLRSALIEDKVAYAIVNHMPLIVFHGLQDMGMMAYQDVGTRINEQMSLLILARQDPLVMLPTPMQTHDNIGCGILLTNLSYTGKQRIERLLSDTRKSGKVRSAFQR